MDQGKLDKLLNDYQKNLGTLSLFCEELSKKPLAEKSALSDLCRFTEVLSRMTRLRVDILYGKIEDADFFAIELNSIISEIRRVTLSLRGVFPDVDFEAFIIHLSK